MAKSASRHDSKHYQVNADRQYNPTRDTFAGLLRFLTNQSPRTEHQQGVDRHVDIRPSPVSILALVPPPVGYHPLPIALTNTASASASASASPLTDLRRSKHIIPPSDCEAFWPPLRLLRSHGSVWSSLDINKGVTIPKSLYTCASNSIQAVKQNVLETLLLWHRR